MVLSIKEFNSIIKNIASRINGLQSQDKEDIVESSLKEELLEEKLNDKNCVSSIQG